MVKLQMHHAYDRRYRAAINSDASEVTNGHDNRTDTERLQRIKTIIQHIGCQRAHRSVPMHWMAHFRLHTEKLYNIISAPIQAQYTAQAKTTLRTTNSVSTHIAHHTTQSAFLRSVQKKKGHSFRCDSHSPGVPQTQLYANGRRRLSMQYMREMRLVYNHLGGPERLWPCFRRTAN